MSGLYKKQKNILHIICYIFYYFFARHLPASYSPYALGSKTIRYWICKRMFARCGKNVNIEHGADIGSGRYIEIGDNSGIGINCVVKFAVIGDNVMMGPEVVFIAQNHKIDDSGDEPVFKGATDYPPIHVGDFAWIGTRSIILPGRNIGRHAIVGAGAVVTKDVPDYAIVAGNPARIIRLLK